MSSTTGRSGSTNSLVELWNGQCGCGIRKRAIKTTTVSLEEEKRQPRQLTSASTAVAGGCLNATATRSNSTVTLSPMTPIDPQPIFPLSLPPKDKFKLAVRFYEGETLNSRSAIISVQGNAAANGLSKRQARRMVTVMDGNYRVSSAENDRYQLSRQDASVSHARRSPLGSYRSSSIRLTSIAFANF
uniref:Uncharacterized protein n=1 Tax=Elaeophora elaphi TaxID=1147741 RepID=A0A0R3RK90_9BILA